MKRPRVLLADDHALVLDGLRRTLEIDCELVGAVEDGRALLAAAEKLRPDIILLDISMPLLNGVEAARQLRRTLPKTKIVFVTMHADATYVNGALRAGAFGYVLKSCAAAELQMAIREVQAGRLYVTPLVKELVADDVSRSSDLNIRPRIDLSGRQREVLQLVAEGHSDKDIAFLLGVSVKTVGFHKMNIKRKLGIHTTAQLTKFALDHGIIAT